MRTYCKINTMFKRDTSKAGRNRIIPGDWATPELDYLSGNDWVFTEKVDGTNIRVFWGDGVRTYGGRTDNAQLPAVLLPRLDEIFATDRLKKAFEYGPVMFYGEGYGPKIQSGARYTEAAEHQHDFVLFDVEVLSQDGWLWLEYPNVEDIAAKLGIPVVPVIGSGTLEDAAKLAENGFASRWNDALQAEGIVARPAVDLMSRRGERLITKIKAKDYRDLRR